METDGNRYWELPISMLTSSLNSEFSSTSGLGRSDASPFRGATDIQVKPIELIADPSLSWK